MNVDAKNLSPRLKKFPSNSGINDDFVKDKSLFVVLSIADLYKLIVHDTINKYTAIDNIDINSNAIPLTCGSAPVLPCA